jgi:thiosulfate/3-mercaptopyruvate sulfurtransferase
VGIQQIPAYIVKMNLNGDTLEMKKITVTIVLTLCFLLVLSIGASYAAEYAHPEVLASTEWLATNLKDPTIVIVDSRSPQDGTAYAGGHIPGAVKLDPLVDLADPQNKVKYQMLTIGQFEELMGKLGISNNKTVVVYDASGGLYSAYLWWGLKYYGHDNVKILNGGLTKWLKEGRPTEKVDVQPVKATFKAQVRPELLSTIPDVKQAIASPDIYIVDALPEANHIAGHIPTAKNIPAPSHIDPATQTLLSPEVLMQLWAQEGLNPKDRVITYCGGGLYGSFDTFIAYLLGYEKVSLYDGSWIEWSADPSLPIEKGSISTSGAKILQVNFKINISGNEYEKAAAGAAPVIADVAGLRWKVWIMNEAEHETGGIYLFDDQSSLEAFLAGPIVAKVKSNPAYSNISMKQFDVLDKLTQVTRGPIDLKQILAAVGKTAVAGNIKILQVNFKISISGKAYEQAVAGAAPVIADVAGLRWKVWIMNEAEHEAGGIYLFDDQSSLDAFLAGPIVAKVKSNPAYSDISMKQFDVLDKLTQVTRGPIGRGEDFSNTFFMKLDKGLNMISMPLKPQKEMTARDLMKEANASAVVKYDTATGRFSGFTEAEAGNGFSIEGGKGYIINAKANGVVPFVGAAWTNKPIAGAPPIKSESSGWAFVLSGTLTDQQGSNYIVSVKNLRTGALTNDSISGSSFDAVFADLTRNPVIEAGDKLEITINDSSNNVVAGPVTYQIGAEDIDKAFKNVVVKYGRAIPESNVLLQNYPNPFNPETWIPFNIAKDSDINVRIYDGSGKLVRNLALGRKEAGIYASKDKAIHWDGKSDAGDVVASGIYFYTIQAGEFSATRKMIVNK